MVFVYVCVECGAKDEATWYIRREGKSLANGCLTLCQHIPQSWAEAGNLRD